MLPVGPLLFRQYESLTYPIWGKFLDSGAADRHKLKQFRLFFRHIDVGKDIVLHASIFVPASWDPNKHKVTENTKKSFEVGLQLGYITSPDLQLCPDVAGSLSRIQHKLETSITLPRILTLQNSHVAIPLWLEWTTMRRPFPQKQQV